MNKLISIVIPSYNQGKYLEETLLSLFDQQYSALEVLVIDGGSTDQSTEIIKRYSEKIAYSVSEKDRGQSHAINKGLLKAKGEIVSWLGSDDLLKPGSLNKINEAFSNLPETTGLIHGRSMIFTDKKVIRDDSGYRGECLERQLSGMTFPQPSSFFRKSVLEKTGLLNESLHFGMDYDLFARMSLITEFHFENFLFSGYRLHEQSKSQSSQQKFITEWMVIFNSILDGLGLKEISEIMDKLEFKTGINSDISDYFKNHRPATELNAEKLLFFFLTNIIKFDYDSANFTRAAKAGNYINKHLKKYLPEEKDIAIVIQRLKWFPPFMIKFFRHFTR